MRAVPYSRYRALPVDKTKSDTWKVVTEAGHAAPEPSTFPEHRDAQRRADELNSAEQAAYIKTMRRKAS